MIKKYTSLQLSLIPASQRKQSTTALIMKPLKYDSFHLTLCIYVEWNISKDFEQTIDSWWYQDQTRWHNLSKTATSRFHLWNIGRHVQLADNGHFLYFNFDYAIRTQKQPLALSLVDNNNRLFPQSPLDLKKIKHFPIGDSVTHIYAIDLQTKETFTYFSKAESRWKNGRHLFHFKTKNVDLSLKTSPRFLV